MLELRMLWPPAAVSTPGRLAMNAEPFCETSGSLSICVAVSVALTAAVCVCTSSVCATTSIVSSSVPSASVIFGRFAGAPAVGVTFLRTAFLNPCSVTVTV